MKLLKVIFKAMTHANRIVWDQARDFEELLAKLDDKAYEERCCGKFPSPPPMWNMPQRSRHQHTSFYNPHCHDCLKELSPSSHDR